VTLEPVPQLDDLPDFLTIPETTGVLAWTANAVLGARSPLPGAQSARGVTLHAGALSEAGVTVSDSTDHGVSGSGQCATGLTGRQRGRPRKWSSDAERQAAYRARRRLEVADADRLRRQLREARSALTRLTRERDSLARQLTKYTKQKSDERETVRLRDELRSLQAKFRALNADYLRVLTNPSPFTLGRSTPAPPPWPPGRS
jgi:hypothetical protein